MNIDLLGFLLHLAGAVLTAVLSMRCDVHSDTMLDVHGGSGAGLVAFGMPEYNMSAGAGRCLRGLDDGACVLEGLPVFQGVYAQGRLRAFALLGHFEWISAGFCLMQWWGTGAWACSLCMSGLAAILFAVDVHGADRANAGLVETSWLMYGTVVAGSVFVFASWYMPALNKKDRVVLRYAEYVVTAPELFVAVLLVVVKDPPFFAVASGAVLVALCNLYGLVMQTAWDTLRAIYYDGEGVGPIGTHLCCFVDVLMLQAWVLLVVALGWIFYLGGSAAFTSGDVPWFVRVGLWTLMVLYNSFGLWSIVTIVLELSEGTTGTGYAVLSIVAKIQLVAVLSVGFVVSGMGAPVCSF